MFIITAKRYRREIADWEAKQGSQRAAIVLLEEDKERQDAVLKSTERKRILLDLEEALHLIQKYQNVLVMLGAPDPSIAQAHSLLHKYGMKGNAAASYLGFQQTQDFKVPLKKPDELIDLETIIIDENAKDSSEKRDRKILSRWDEEEKIWGDEAYGKGTVTIEAEAIDEGEDKKPGYTRAKIRFNEPVLETDEPY